MTTLYYQWEVLRLNYLSMGLRDVDEWLDEEKTLIFKMLQYRDNRRVDHLINNRGFKGSRDQALRRVIANNVCVDIKG